MSSPPIVEPIRNCHNCGQSVPLGALDCPQCHSLLYNQLWSPSAKGARWPLSYRMAGVLPLELPEKQELLEMRAEPARQAFLHKWLERILVRLDTLNRSRRRAAANGHRLN